MADVMESDVDYSDEEWPDNDVDPETAEGAAKIRRSEAALAASFQREAEMRRQKFRVCVLNRFEQVDTLLRGLAGVEQHFSLAGENHRRGGIELLRAIDFAQAG